MYPSTQPSTPGRFQMLSVWMMTTAFTELFLRARSFVGTHSFIILQHTCSVGLSTSRKKSAHFRDEGTKAQSAHAEYGHALAEWLSWHSHSGLEVHSLGRG